MTEPLTSCGDSAKSVATDHPLNNLPYRVFSSAALTPRFCAGDFLIEGDQRQFLFPQTLG
jgi:hypothetical protein